MILAIAAFLVGALTGPPTRSLPEDPSFWICSLADSIAAESNIEDLVALIDTAATLDPRQHPEAQVEAGLAAFSLGRSYNDRDYLRQALDRLNDVKSAYSEDACYFYQRGLVRRELGARPPFIAEVWARLRNQDHKELAMQDFRQAALLRPDWLPPAIEMAEIAIAPFEGRVGRRDRWREWALAALDGYREAGGTDPEVDLYRSGLLIEDGAFEEAYSAALRLNDSAPSGLADLELARTLFALDRPDHGAEAYWRAVAGAWDERFLLEMERDLRPIFSPQETVEWAQVMTDDERAAWVRRFWSMRAARDLVSEGERLTEHYARLRYARENYRRVSEAQVRLQLDRFIRSNDEVLDDRGLIHVRMGEPDETIPCLAAGELSHSWVYRGEDGSPLVLHLSGGGGTDDWTFVTLLPLNCYARLGSRDPRYNTLGFDLFQGDGLQRLHLGTMERNRVETTVNYALSRDKHRLPLDGRLEFGYEWLFFRGAEPGTIATTLGYAIPIRHLQCKNDDGSVACRLEVRASVFGRDRVVARGSDTGQLDPLARRTWVLGQFDMTAVSGNWNYKVAAFEMPTGESDDLQRGNWGRGRFTVPALWRGKGSSAVNVSSLVLARPGEGDWVRGEEALALNPMHIYRPDATVELYYEIYGLSTDAHYTTEIVLVRAKNPPVQSLDPPAGWVDDLLDDKRSALRLRFDEVASDNRPWVARRKTVTLRGIGEGQYVLVVAIKPYDEAATIYRVTPLYVDRDAG